MNEGYDVAEAMRRGIAGRAEAWSFIRDFAARWTRPLRPSHGVDQDELGEAEEALGFALPAALREAYLLFGRRDDLTRNQDRLLHPRALGVDDTGEVLVFRNENQSVASWGTRMSDISDPDPPVVVEHGEGWRPFLDRISLACVEMVLSEVLFGSDFLENAAEVPAEVIGSVEATYPRVNFPEYPSWADSQQPVRWYSAPGQLLRMDGGGEWAWLFVRGRTDEDLHRIYRSIPRAEWTLGNGLP